VAATRSPSAAPCSGVAHRHSQAGETHEIIIDKSYWTWGGEIGVRHGVAVGNEAIFSNVEEKGDGLITGDLLRLMLERAKNCEEALQVFGEVLAAHGQGGNCELRGNSHFDSSYLVSDKSSAYVIESAGREWAARKVEGVGAISNALTIGSDWQRCSLPQNGNGRTDSPPPMPTRARRRARARQKVAFEVAEGARGKISLRTMADLLRQHPRGATIRRKATSARTSACMPARIRIAPGMPAAP
jgi:hypothetical protein